MDYLALPPEMNSARIEAGPGATPLLEAASAWNSLADQLALTASQHAMQTADLGAAWQGLSASAFNSASATFTAWLTTTATMATTTATAASMAAASYETARATMVPLVAVTANRVQLAALVATNILGQNTPAIMVTEATYAEMWAQDVAGMVAYQSESAAATALLQPPAPAPQVTTGLNPAGAATQTVPSASTQSILSWLTTPNNFLTALGNPATPAGFLEAQWLALQSSGVYQVLSYPLILGLMSQANGMMGRANDLTEEGNRISTELEEDDRAQAKMTPPVAEQPPPAHIERSSPGGVGKVGALTVPPNWDKTTEQVRLASAASPLGGGRMGGMMPMPIAAVNPPQPRQRKADEVLQVKLILPKNV